MPKRYPAEFRRKVLDLVAAGRPVAQVAADLAISEQTIYVWRRQHLIDTGQLPGRTSSENAELVAARRRIAELEAEVAIHRRAAPAARRGGVPKRRFEAIAVMASETLPVQLGCRVLGVSESGYYDWRTRPPSTRSLRHVWLTEQIRPKRPKWICHGEASRSYANHNSPCRIPSISTYPPKCLPARIEQGY